MHCKLFIGSIPAWHQIIPRDKGGDWRNVFKVSKRIEFVKINPEAILQYNMQMSRVNNNYCINVPLIFKMRDIILLRANYFMGHFKGYFEEVKKVKVKKQQVH
jgi:hypothetical protein